MKLTRLRLHGFKSFVEPTDFMIEPGLTGVVASTETALSCLFRLGVQQGVYAEIGAVRRRNLIEGDTITLSRLIEDRLLPLRDADEARKREGVVPLWSSMPAREISIRSGGAPATPRAVDSPDR